MVGYHLHKNRIPGIKVAGTLEDPIHARNIEDFINTLNDRTLVIAVDATLGQFCSVGCVRVKSGSIKPGSGLNKDLPPVGDVSIVGIVNQGGWMDFMVLQNTRLGLVMKMAEVISEAIKHALTKRNPGKPGK